MIDYIEAHSFSANHMEQLKKDSRCGCFHCERIFKPSEITDWIMADNDCDRLGTALCPYCGVDAVIGESSGLPITEEFLFLMRRQWFGEPKELRKNPFRMKQYLPQIRPLINALWDYAIDELSWDALRTLLEEKKREPAFGVKLGHDAGWARYTPPEILYAAEYALMEQVLCSGPEEAKAAIDAFFRSEPEMTPERIYILSKRCCVGCPPFLEMMIGPLYGYLVGKVPSEVIIDRLKLAVHCWQNHERPETLQESYLPEGQLMVALVEGTQKTTFGDPDSEAEFRKAMLSAMEAYVRKPNERKHYLLY